MPEQPEDEDLSMASTFVVYIDESGDEGFSFSQGSSEWFVLSAVVTRRSNDLDTVKLVDEVRSALGRPPRKPLHFRKLRHHHKLALVNAIAQADLRAVSILVHKPTLREPEKFMQRYRLYFYTARYLLERVSWYCRDARRKGDAGDGTAELVFSNRSGMSYGELGDYLRYLHDRSGLFDVRIDWDVIRPDQVRAFTPGKRMGLQIADAVAGSAWSAVERSQYGFTESRYLRMLAPIVYAYKGKCLGYGLKLWPRDVVDLIHEDEYAWLLEDFQ